MGFRFRKSIKIIPGVRLNLSKSGISTSLGGKGATVNIGKRSRATIGIPGTGISYVQPLTGKRRKVAAPAPLLAEFGPADALVGDPLIFTTPGGAVVQLQPLSTRIDITLTKDGAPHSFVFADINGSGDGLVITTRSKEEIVVGPEHAEAVGTFIATHVPAQRTEVIARRNASAADVLAGLGMIAKFIFGVISVVAIVLVTILGVLAAAGGSGRRRR